MDGFDTDDEEFNEIASQVDDDGTIIPVLRREVNTVIPRPFPDCHPCPLNKPDCPCQTNEQCDQVMRKQDCSHYTTISSQSFVSPIMLLFGTSLVHHLRELEKGVFFADQPREISKSFHNRFPNSDAMQRSNRESFPLGLQVVIPKNAIMYCPQNRHNLNICTIICSMFVFIKPDSQQKLGLLVFSLWLPRSETEGDLLTLYLGTTVMKRSSELTSFFLNVVEYVMRCIDHQLGCLDSAHRATTLIFLTNTTSLVNNMLHQIVKIRCPSFRNTTLVLQDDKSQYEDESIELLRKASIALDSDCQRTNFRKVLLDVINVQAFNPLGFADHPDKLYLTNKNHASLIVNRHN